MYIYISQEISDSNSDQTSLALTTCMAIEFVTHVCIVWLVCIYTYGRRHLTVIPTIRLRPSRHGKRVCDPYAKFVTRMHTYTSKELPDSDSDLTSLALTTCTAIETVTHIQSSCLEYIHTHITGATWQWFWLMSSAPTTIMATEFVSQMQSSWLESIHTHITGATWQWFRLMSSAPTTIIALRYVWVTNCCVYLTQSSRTKCIWMIIEADILGSNDTYSIEVCMSHGLCIYSKIVTNFE